MQAPHWPAPQPNLVPVSLSSSRSTHRRRVLSGALTLTGLPLTLKLIAISTPMCLGRAGFVRGWLSTMLLPAQNRGQCCAATNRISVAPVPRLWRRIVWVSFGLAAPPAIIGGRKSPSTCPRENHEPHDPESSARCGHRAARCRIGRRIYGENSVPAVAGVLARRHHGRR